jgi:HEPN domain-containing protein
LNNNTKAWLEFAVRDYESAKKLLSDEFLANVVLFHSQQCIEKSLKAIFEELNVEIPRINSVVKLYKLIKDTSGIVIDEDVLTEIDSIYFESRYPASIGLLPSGFPTKYQAGRVFEKGEEVFKMILEYLDTNKEHLGFM